MVLLMTKFGKARNTGLSDLGFWSIRFSQIQRRVKEGAKFEDPTIFKHEKGKVRHQETKTQENSSLKSKLQKLDVLF
jgi:hypothetical protein